MMDFSGDSRGIKNIWTEVACRALREAQPRYESSRCSAPTLTNFRLSHPPGSTTTCLGNLFRPHAICAICACLSMQRSTQPPLVGTWDAMEAA